MVRTSLAALLFLMYFISSPGRVDGAPAEVPDVDGLPEEWGTSVNGLRCRLQVFAVEPQPPRDPITTYCGEKIVLRGLLFCDGETWVAVPGHSDGLSLRGRRPTTRRFTGFAPRRPAGEAAATLPAAEPDNDAGRFSAGSSVSPPYATLEVRLPDGRVLLRDPYGRHRADSNPSPPRLQELVRIERGKTCPLPDVTLHLTSSGPGWVDAATHQPAMFSFAQPGAYAIRMSFEVKPMADKSPGAALAWSGTATTPWIRMTLQPASDKPQVRALTPVQKECIAGRNYDLLEKEMYDVSQDLLARTIIDEADRNPGVAGRLLQVVARRAVPAEELGDTIAIDGKYLKAYVDLMLDIADGQLVGYQNPRRSGGTRIVYDDFVRPVTLYALKHPEDEATCRRIRFMASKFGAGFRDPPTENDALERQEAISHPSPAVCWAMSIELGDFHPGSDRWYPEFSLGKPTIETGNTIAWIVQDDRPVRAGLYATLKDGKVERYEIRKVYRGDPATRPTERAPATLPVKGTPLNDR